MFIKVLAKSLATDFQYQLIHQRVQIYLTAKSQTEVFKE